MVLTPPGFDESQSITVCNRHTVDGRDGRWIGIRVVGAGEMDSERPDMGVDPQSLEFGSHRWSFGVRLGLHEHVQSSGPAR